MHLELPPQLRTHIPSIIISLPFQQQVHLELAPFKSRTTVPDITDKYLRFAPAYK
jgi:hypothetical protein